MPRRRRCALSRAVLMTAAFLLSHASAQTAPATHALPSGGQVAAGQVTLAQTGALSAPTLTVTQSSDRAIVNWQSFDVGKDAAVRFVQPSASSAILNRVVGADPTRIFGQLSANGQVLLVNPQGVYFSPTSRVDVGALVASTLSIGDEDFLAGRLNFRRAGATGSVVNEGEIRTALGGYVALLAPEVRNAGVIVAEAGSVLLAAGEAVNFNFDPQAGVTGLLVEPARVRALVENGRIVQAPGGQIIFSAQAHNEVAAGVIRNTGEVAATGITQVGGRILLEASDTVEQGGRLDASSATSKGGDIQVTADAVSLLAGSVTSATGATGGGRVLLGGDWQGGGSLPTAREVRMQAGASIDVSALGDGAGGTAVLWSDVRQATSLTTASGVIRALGGVFGGDGGRVETSGYTLRTDGLSVDTRAPLGRTGDWLLDPVDITIATSGGNLTPTQLRDGLLTSNVTISTAGSGSATGVSPSYSAGSGNITISNQIESLSPNSLTLTADNNINVNAIIAMGGALTLNAGTAINLGANVITGGDQTYNGPVNLTAAVTLNSYGWDVTAYQWLSSYGALNATFAGSSATFRVVGGTGGQGGSDTMVGMAGGASGDYTATVVLSGNTSATIQAGAGGGAGANAVTATGGGAGGTGRTGYQGGTGGATGPTGNSGGGGGGGAASVVEILGGTLVGGGGGGGAGGNNVSGDGETTGQGATSQVASGNAGGAGGSGGTPRADGGGSGGGGGGILGGKGGVGVDATTETSGRGGYAGTSGAVGVTVSGVTQTTYAAPAANANGAAAAAGYNGFVAITGRLVSSTGPGIIRFTSTVNGAQALTLNAGTRNVQLEGDVGGTTPIGALTVTGGGVTFGSGARNILTGGSQAWNAPLNPDSAAIQLQTRGAAGLSYGIDLNQGVTKSVGTDASLTVRAHRDISLGGAVTVSAGKLDLLFEADSENSGSAVTHDGVGFTQVSAGIATNGGFLKFGTGATATVNGVSVLVGGDVYVTGASGLTFATGGGAFESQGELLIGNASGLTITTSGGAATFAGAIDAGNTYASVVTNVTWSSAQTAAASGTQGAAGSTYLATITSRLENMIAIRAANYDTAWLGGRRTTGISTNQVWRWVTGPEGLMDSSKGLQFFTENYTGSGGTAIGGAYTNWSTGEPNNSGGANTDTAGEPYLQFTGVNGTWNDLSATSTTPNRYVKETLLAASPFTVNAGAGAVTFSGPVGQKKALGATSVTGGVVSMSGAFSVGTDTLTVTAATSATGTSAALTAASLVLQGAGTHSFTNAANNVTTLAAGTVAQPVGGLAYFDADTLSVGTVGSVVGIRANGAVEVASGGILTLAANVSAANANAAVVFKSAADILQNASLTMQTNAGDLVFWSNTTAQTTGNRGILISDGAVLDTRTAADRVASTHTTGGGLILLGGGNVTATSAKGTTIPTGYALNYTSVPSGLMVGSYNSAVGHNANVRMYSGGGDVVWRGKSTQNVGSLTIGISAFEGVVVNAGTAGNITVDGVAVGNTTAAGMDIHAWRASAASSSYLTVDGNILFTGSGTGATTNVGTQLGSSASYPIILAAAGAGTVTVKGLTTGTFTDVNLTEVQLLSGSGSVTVQVDRAGGKISENGTSTTLKLGQASGTVVTSSSASVLMKADVLDVTSTNGVAVNTAGTVEFTSYDATAFSSAVAFSRLDVGSAVSAAATNIASFTFGKTTNNVALTVTAGGINARGPIRLYGSNLTVSAPLRTDATFAEILLKGTGFVQTAANLTTTGATSPISLLAGSYVNLSVASTIRTSGSNLLVASNTDATGGGHIYASGDQTIITSGGSVTFAGGAADGSGYAEGSSVSIAEGIRFFNGLSIDTSVKNAGSSVGGGDIVIRGRSFTSANGAYGAFGVGVETTTNLDSGTATIRLDGISRVSSGDSYNMGVRLLGDVTATSASTSATAIYFSGTGGSAASSYSGGQGLRLTSGNNLLSTTGAGGGIKLSGTPGSQVYAVVFQGGSIVSASGPIELSGTAANSKVYLQNVPTIGFKAGTPVTASTANITFLFDDADWGGSSSPYIATSGSFTWRPSGTSFGRAISTNWLNLPATTLSGYTIGSATNTALIYFNTALTVQGPVTAQGGYVELSQAINAAGDVLLDSNRGVTVPYSIHGVYAYAPITTTAASNGNITLIGRGGNSGANYGIYLTTAAALTAGGSGSITLTGQGGINVGSSNYGIYVPANLTTSSGNITLTGTGGSQAGSTDSDGILVEAGTIIKTGTGNITLTGIPGSGANSEAINFRTTSAITLGAVGQSGNVTIQGDSFLTSTSNINILGAGAVVIEPNTANFTATLDTQRFSVPSTAASLRLGKSGNTGGVTVTNAVSLAGPITVFGGAVALNAALSSSTADIGITTSALAGSGGLSIPTGKLLTITQSGTSTYDGVISGAGAFTKAGTGTLSLSANSTFTGATSISAGGLALGGGGTSGWLSGTSGIAVDGTLQIWRGDDVAISLPLSGAGTLEVKGAYRSLFSTQLTTTAQTVASNTTVAEVLRRITGGQLNGSAVTGAPSNAAAYQVSFDSVANVGRFQLQFWDTGYVKTVFVKLVQSGSNVQALVDQASPYTNGTGYLAVNQLGQDMATYAGVNYTMSLATTSGSSGYGVGRLDIAGKATLSNIGSFTGTLKLTTATETGTGSVVYTRTIPGVLEVSNGFGTASSVVNNGLLIVSGATSSTLSAPITGIGAVHKYGSGTTTFAQAVAYTGETLVGAGGLTLNSTYGSSLHTILSGATLTLDTSGGDRDYATATFRGTGTLAKTGANRALWSTSVATFALGSGGMIDVQGGIFTASSNSNEVWTNNLSDLNVASGARFAVVEGAVRIDALTGAGDVTVGYAGGLGSLTLGVDNHTVGAYSTAGAATFSGVIADTGVSATGAVTKAGTGTQVFSGANTFTRGTTVSAGTLSLGASGTSGSLAGDVVNNATLTFDRSDNLTFAGVISGTGAVTKLGTNVLTLTGASSYSGTTTISAGTLRVGNGATAGTLGTGTVTDNGILDFARTDLVLVNNVISGTGSVTSAGGILALLGANTFAGGTTITGGAVGAYHNTALGSGTLTIGGATLQVGRAVTTVANAIALTGATTIGFDQSVDYLIVGGGGGGGGGQASAHGGGGGGGGGVKSGSANFASGSFALTVGIGGTAGSANTSIGGTGGSSTFGGVTAAGGGGGGQYFYGAPTSGASGGGGAVSATVAWQSGAAGTAGQGFAGGNSSGASPNASAGGGGGAGGVGGNYSGTTGGAGGLGLASGITGSQNYYGGGGGGGGTLGGAGGSGVGGAGGAYATAGTAGSVNTGSGGGGGMGSGGSAATNGGAGGTGVVYVRYLGASAGTGGTVAAGTGAATGYTLHSFTTTGAGTLALSALSATLSGAISGTGALTADATGGTFTLTGANTYVGATTLPGGTVRVGAGAGTGSLGVGGITNNATLIFNRTGTLTVSGVISGTGTLEQAGSGTVVLDGANTYSGATTVSAGTLAITDAAGLGTTAAGTTVASGATLDLRGVLVGAEALTINGGTLAASTGTSGLTGAITLGASSTLSVGGTQLTLDGIVSGASFGLVKSGTGLAVLNGANTFGGSIDVNAGTLRVGGAGKLAAGTYVGALTVASGATFDFASSANQIFGNSANAAAANTLRGAGAFTFDGTGTVTLRGDFSTTGSITVGQALTMAGGTNGTNTGLGLASSIEILNGGTITLTGGANSFIGSAATPSLTVRSGGKLTTDGSSGQTFHLGTTTLDGGEISTGTGATTTIWGIFDLDKTITVTADSTLSSQFSTMWQSGGTVFNVAAGKTLTVSGTLVAPSSAADNGLILNSAAGSTGTLVLSGVNTYTGATTITRGTLRLGGAGQLGSGTYANTISNAGAFEAATSASQTLSGVISGAGTLTQSGAGTTTLTATNTYTGATTVSAGVLQVGAGATTGALAASTAVSIASGATLRFYRADATSVAIANAISGAGTLEFRSTGANGVGVYSLTGTDTLSASAVILINQARLIVDGQSYLSSSLPLIRVLTGGQLYINRTGAIANPLELGAGLGWKETDGTQLGILHAPSWNAAGPVTFSGNVTLTGNSSVAAWANQADITMAGVISDGGNGYGFTKLGSLKLTLTGANTFTGTTTISAGTLQVGASGTTGVIGGSIVNNSALIFDRSDDLTFAQAISGTGTLSKSGSNTLTLTGGASYSGSTAVAAGGLVFRQNTAPSTSGFTGAGAVTIEPAGATFTSAVTAGYSYATTLTGLTIGKSTNTSAVTLSSAVNIAGPITVYGGDVTLSANLTSTASGAAILAKGTGNVRQAGSVVVQANGGNVSLVAAGDIYLQTSASIQSQGGAILLSSNLDGVNGGSITLHSTTLNSAGGNITLGGGLLGDGSGYAEGSASASPTDAAARYRGIYLVSSTLTAAGGNVALRGKGWQGAAWNSADSGYASYYALGIDYVVGTAISTTGTGTLTLDGVGGINYNANTHGAGINFFTSTTANSLSTAGGAITVTGAAGTGTTRAPAGIQVDAGTVNIVSTSGNIAVSGTGASTDTGLALAGATAFNVGWNGTGAATSGSVTLSADRLTSANTAIRSSGAVSLQPVGTKFLSALSTANFSFGTAATSLVIGKATNDAAVTVANNLSVAGPISVYGGDVTLTGGLAASAAGDVLVRSSGTLTVAASRTVTTTNGNVTLTAGRFVNNSGASALSAGGTGKTWSVWSTNPDPYNATTGDVLGSLAFDFRQYDATYGVTAVQGTGKGLFYSYAPTLVSSLTTTPTKVYDRTDAATVTNAMVTVASGLAGGDLTPVFTFSAATYASRNAGNGQAITFASAPTVLAQSSVASGSKPVYGYRYSGLSAPTGNITPLALTVSGAVAANKVYDRLLTTTVSGGSITALAGDTVTLDASAGVGTFATKNVGTGKALTVTGYALAGADAGNYSVVQPAGLTADITALSLALTGVTAANKTYDRLLAATLSGGSIAPIAGDTVTLVSSGRAGVFVDKNVGTSKAVTVSGYTITGADAANYSLVQPAGLTANITQLSLNVTGATAASRVYDQGVTAAISGGTIAPLSGDTVTLDASGKSGVFANKNVGTAKAVTVSGYAISGADAVNYSLVQPTGVTADITALSLAVTGATAANKVYDRLSTTTVSGGVIAPLAGDVVTLDDSGRAGAFATKTVGVGKAVTVTGYTLTGADAANYALVQPTGLTADVTQRTLTITGVSAANKTYDALLAATLSGGAIAALAGDTVTLVASGKSGSFADKNVGTAKAVTVTGYAITGADAANYALVQPTGLTADITQLALNVTGASAASRVYDQGVTAAISGGTIAPLSGDTVTLDASGKSGVFANKNVGTAKAITVSGYAISGADAANYSLVQPTGVTADITARSLAVTGAAAANKVYDRLTSATVSGGSIAPLAGDVVTLDDSGRAGAFGDKNVGTAKAVTVTGYALAGADAANYALVQPTGLTADITVRTLTINGVTAANKTYDALTAATLSGGSIAQISGDAVTLVTTGKSGVFADKNVGTGKAVTASGYTISGADSANYSIVQPAGLTADITQLALNVTGATVANKVYDRLTTATVSGGSIAPISGDTVTLDASGRAGAFANKNVGTAKAVTINGYTISGADAANYSLVQPTGVTADITALSLAVTGAAAANKVYDRLTSATVSGGSIAPLAGDVVTLDDSGRAGTFATKNVGTGKAVTVTGYAIAGADAANYSLVQPAGLTADIAQLTLNVTGASAISRVYDQGVNAAISGGAVSPISGDTVTLDATARAGAFGDKNVGTAKAVTVTGYTISGADAANYSLVQPAGLTADITQLTLNVTGASVASRVYNRGVSAAVSGGAIAPISGDAVTLDATARSGVFGDKNVGTAKAVTVTGYTISGADAANYSLVQPAGLTADITQLTLNVTGATAASRVYDQGVTTAISGGTISPLSGDTVTLDASARAGVFADKNVGTGKAVMASGYTISGADSANYFLVQPVGLTADITQLALNVTGASVASRVYNQGVSAAVSGGAIAPISGDAVTLDATARSGVFGDKNVGTAKPVTVTGYAISGADAANYSLVQPAGLTADIAQLTLNITGASAASRVYDQGVVAAISGGTISVIAGDTVTLDASARSGAFGDKNVGTGKAVTASGYTISGADAANYALVQPAGLTADITPLTLNINGATVANKVYDRLTTATVSGGSITPISGDTVTLDASGRAGTFADKNVGIAKAVTVAGYALSGADAANYALVQPAGLTADITQLTLNVTGATAASRVYNQGVNAVISGGSISPISGDTVTLDAAARAGVFADKNVGTAKAVTVTGYTISGADAANYSLVQPAGLTADITQLTLNVTGASAASRVYDQGVNVAISGGAIAPIAGDAVTLNTTARSGVFGDKNVGTAKAITVTGYVINGTDAANYSLVQPAGLTADVTQLTLDITGATAASRVYDQSVNATISGGAIAPISGDAVTLDVTARAGTFGDKNVGTAKAVTVTGYAITGADAANYSLVQPAGLTADITRLTLNVTGAAAASRVYDQNVNAVISGGAIAPIAGDTVTLDATARAGVFADKNVGTAKAVTVTGYTISGADAANYSLVQPAGLTADITQLTLNITGASAASRVYDQGVVAAISGGAIAPIAGDTVTLDASARAGTFANKNVGTAKPVTVTGYAISGADAANYALVQPVGLTADVTQLTLNITGASAASRVYDQSVNATISGGAIAPIAGDTVTLDATARAGVFADKNVGMAKAITVTGYAINGTDAANYFLVQPVGLTADITQLTLNVTGALAASRVYDQGVNAVISGGAIAPIAGDTVTLDASTRSGVFADKNVGTGKAVTVTGYAITGADAANYALVQPAGLTADITQLTLNITGASAASRIYDQGIVATISGGAIAPISGDAVTLDALGRAGVFGDKNVGTAKSVTVSGYTISGADAANYSLVQPAGLTADITQLTLNVTGASAASRVYDQSVNAVISGGAIAPIAGDTVTLDATARAGVFADKNVGTAKAVTVTGYALSGADAANYSLVQPVGLTADITQLALNVTGASVASRVYNQSVLAVVFGGAIAPISGDAVTLDASARAGAFADKNVGTAKSVTVTGYAISGADAANYSLVQPAGLTADITQLTLNITGASAASRVYDQGIVATISGGAIAPISGDAVTLDASARSGVFGDKNVGTAKSVTVSGYTISGADAANYSLVQPAGLTADITQLTLNITGASAASRVYDQGVNAAISGGAISPISGDAVTLDATARAGTFADKNVGTGKAVTVTGYAITGADAANYALVQPAGLTADITQLTLNITGASAASRVYDQGIVATISGGTIAPISGDTVTLDASGRAGTFADKNVGVAKAVTVTGYAITGADAANYSLVQPAGLIADVTPFILHVDGASAASRVYDQSVNVAISGGTIAPISGDSVSLDAFARSGVFGDKNVGTAKAVTVTGYAITGTDAANYSLVQPAGLTADITPLALNVTGASAASKTYDALTATAISGGAIAPISGDVVALDASARAGVFGDKNVGAAKTVTVSGYAITGADAANYSLVQPVGLVADITPLSLLVTGVSAANKMRDGNLNAALSGGTISPLVGDLVSLDASAAVGLFADDMIGMGKPVSVSGYALVGADAGNYSLIQPSGLSANITDSGVLYPSVVAAPPLRFVEPAPTVWAPPIVTAVVDAPAGVAAPEIKVSPLSMSTSAPDVLPLGKMLTLSASGDHPISEVRIEMVAGFVAGETSLQVEAPAGFKVTVDNNTGKITLSGDASPTEYAQALKSLVVRATGGKRVASLTLKVDVANAGGASSSTKVVLEGQSSAVGR